MEISWRKHCSGLSAANDDEHNDDDDEGCASHSPLAAAVALMRHTTSPLNLS